MERVKASIALIGVGGNNKFGHPNDMILERLKKNGIIIYRTDEKGEVVIKSDGIKIKDAMVFKP